MVSMIIILIFLYAFFLLYIKSHTLLQFIDMQRHRHCIEDWRTDLHTHSTTQKHC